MDSNLIYFFILESLTRRRRSEARMFSILFVALLGLGFACKPAKSCYIVINEVKELCGFYDYTTVDALEQKHALQIVTHFGSLFTSQCSTFSRILVCSHFVLFCFPPHNHLQPCCNCAKESSHHVFIFSRNSELLGQPLWIAQLCRHRQISVFLLLCKIRLCLCFHLLRRLLICHLFSVRHPHIIIPPSHQSIQLPKCI